MESNMRKNKGPLYEQLVSRLKADYTHSPPDEERAVHHEEVNKTMMEVALKMAAITPICREQSVAFTQLELATRELHAALARNWNTMDRE